MEFYNCAGTFETDWVHALTNLTSLSLSVGGNLSISAGLTKLQQLQSLRLHVRGHGHTASFSLPWGAFPALHTVSLRGPISLCTPLADITSVRTLKCICLSQVTAVDSWSVADLQELMSVLVKTRPLVQLRTLGIDLSAAGL